MKHLSFKHFAQLKTEQISNRILYLLLGLSAVVFCLFYLVGYDVPYVLEPEYNAPVFTDILIIFMYLLLVVSLFVALFAVVKGYKTRSAENIVNGIRVGRIVWGTIVLLVGLLVVTFLLGSSAPVSVNGKTFADVFWLRVTDMFIYTSSVLIVVAVGTVGFSMSKQNRKRKY